MGGARHMKSFSEMYKIVLLLLLFKYCHGVLNPPLQNSSSTLPVPTLPVPTLPVPTLPVPTLPVPTLPVPQETGSTLLPIPSGIDLPECPFEVDPIWGIPWSPTIVGKTAVQPCPPGFQGTASRFCLPNNNWKQPHFANCVGDGFSDDFKNEAMSFFEKGSKDVTVSIFLINQLSNFSKPPQSDGPFLTKTDLSTINFVSREALDVLLQEEGDGDQVDDFVDLLNSALDSRNRDSWLELQELESGSEELLNNAEMYAQYLGRTLNSSNIFAKYSRDNLAIRANRFGATDTISDSVFPLESDLVNSLTTDENNIRIPSAYLQSLANENDSDVTVVNMLFTTLHDFLPNSETAVENQTLASVIISSQVFTDDDNGDINVDVLLENPIEIIFTINASYSLINESIQFICVYWNFTDDFNSTAFGSWVSNGIIAERIDDSTVKCYSSHLTSFSVLVDVVADNNETSPEIEQQLLSIVSYIGCSISIICLLVTTIWLLSLGKSLFSEVHNFIHLGLAVSLLLSLTLFVAAIQFASSIKPLCIVVTVLLHYLFLSSFCWMLCEAIMLFILLVIVFSTLIKKWWIYCIIGWGIPVIPVAITIGIDFNNYTSDGICWLNNSNYLVWGFIGPMILIIAINAIVLVVVLIKIFQTKKTAKKSLGSMKDARDIASHLIIGAMVLLPLLGLSWIIGIFAIDVNTTVFAWLFTVLNSLQGATIFFFHVLRSKKFTNKIKSYYRKRRKHMEAKSQLSQPTKSGSIYISPQIETSY